MLILELMVSHAMEKRSLIYANNCPGDHGFLKQFSSTHMAHKCNRCNYKCGQCYGCSNCKYWLCTPCRAKPFQCECCLENVEILIFDTHCLFPCCIQYCCIQCACKGLDLIEFVADLEVHYELKNSIISAIKYKHLTSLKNVCSNIRWRSPNFSLPAELNDLTYKNSHFSIIKIFKDMLHLNFTSFLNSPENKILKQNLFRIFVEDKLTQNSALHYATLKGDIKFAQFLLNRTKEKIINKKNVFGYTPLHFAASRGEYELVQILLKHGAHVNPIGANGKTPLHLASEMGRIETTILLIAHGGQSKQIDFGCSSLTQAIDANKKKIIEKETEEAMIRQKCNMHFLSKIITCKILMLPLFFCRYPFGRLFHIVRLRQIFFLNQKSKLNFSKNRKSFMKA